MAQRKSSQSVSLDDSIGPVTPVPDEPIVSPDSGPAPSEDSLAHPAHLDSKLIHELMAAYPDVAALKLHLDAADAILRSLDALALLSPSLDEDLNRYRRYYLDSSANPDPSSVGSLPDDSIGPADLGYHCSSCNSTASLVATPDVSSRRPHLKTTPLARALLFIARHLDAIGPVALDERLSNRYFARREAAASKDPRWAEIESRRYIPGSENKMFLSEDLSLADWATQDAIATELTPQPFYLRLTNALARYSLASLVSSSLDLASRARHGWATTDAYGFDRYLARLTGEALNHLADNAHSWPCSSEYPTYESWTAALRHHATSLLAYANGANNQALDSWHELVTDPLADPEALAQARRELDISEINILSGAKHSMSWVATHLESLWD